MLEISIDWLQFTSKNPNPVTIIIDVLHLDVKMFIELPKGKLGYKKQLFYNDITVLSDGNEDMGTHVILSGKGCREIENNYPILELVKRLNKLEIKTTRIDLAIDDVSGKIIKLDSIIEDVQNANIVSKWKSSTEITKRSIHDGGLEGQTVYLGSRKSEVFMRIYNKSLQLKLDGNWNRIELEIKGKKSEELQKIMTEKNIGKLTKGLINNYIRIVEPGRDKNKSRWKTKEYWTKIIDTTEKIQLSRKKEEKTLEELKNWIEKQVAPTLATIVMAEGGDVEFLYKQVTKGKHRIKSKHLNIIEKENGQYNE